MRYETEAEFSTDGDCADGPAGRNPRNVSNNVNIPIRPREDTNRNGEHAVLYTALIWSAKNLASETCWRVSVLL